MNVRDKLLNALRDDGEFSIAQARAWFRVTNVAARIHELRQLGYAVYTNQRTRSNGDKVAVYRLGTPRRSMVNCSVLGAR